MIKTIVVAAMAVATTTLTGCGVMDNALNGGIPASSDQRVAPTDLGAALASLTIAPDGPLAGYSRAQFGQGWGTQPDGCDTRDEVLRRQATAPTLQGRCRVTGGQWLSIYDGVTVTDPHQLQIDHLVPLAEAWRTGAVSWTSAQREAYANDVTTELVAVTVHANESKGDQPPPAYEPPDTKMRCDYAVRWVRVKRVYHLTITRPEHDALAAMLATCGG